MKWGTAIMLTTWTLALILCGYLSPRVIRNQADLDLYHAMTAGIWIAMWNMAVWGVRGVREENARWALPSPDTAEQAETVQTESAIGPGEPYEEPYFSTWRSLSHKKRLWIACRSGSNAVSASPSWDCLTQRERDVIRKGWNGQPFDLYFQSPVPASPPKQQTETPPEPQKPIEPAPLDFSKAEPGSRWLTRNNHIVEFLGYAPEYDLVDKTLPASFSDGYRSRHGSWIYERQTYPQDIIGPAPPPAECSPADQEQP